MPFIDIGWMVGVWVGGILCKGDQESHVILYISDKNGTSKLNKLTIFDQKWNFWNLVAMFDKQPIMLNFVAIILLTRVFPNQDIDCRLFFLKSFLKSQKTFAVFEIEFHLGLLVHNLISSLSQISNIIWIRKNLLQDYVKRLKFLDGIYAVIFLYSLSMINSW